MRLIQKIVLSGMVSTVVCSTILLLTYVFKYKSVHFWLVSLGANPDISEPKNIVYIILPSLAISTVVNIIVAGCIGLYASRKFAVPIYKLENWALLLQHGHLNARMTFREREEMKELSTRCNQLADNLRMRFINIKKQTASIKEGTQPEAALKAIDRIVGDLDLESSFIDVHTGFVATPLPSKPKG